LRSIVKRLRRNSDADHLNTPRLVADATGTTVWRWDQAEPFGNNPANEDPDANSVVFDLPLRLPGQRYDAETGLHYNYFRDYDPGLGIYKQSDPIGLKGGVNTYVYVLNSPLFWVDPFGLYTYCRLLSQRCTDSKTIRMGLGLIKVEVCVRRRCLWRCYDDPVGNAMCYNIPCKDGHCEGDHGVEVLEYHGAGSPEYPLGAAPLCEDKNPAARPPTPSSPGQQ
jgi:RHS repeat-associated protein